MSVPPDQMKDDRPVSALPRYFYGDGPSQDRPLSYVLLMPSDRDLPQEEVMRRVVRDTLVRNGYPAEDAVVDKTVQSMRDENGRFDFNRNKDAPQDAERKLQNGPVVDGKREPGFSGYAVALRQDFQESVVGSATREFIAGMSDSPESRARMLDVVGRLKELAGATGNKELENILGTWEKSMKSQETGSAIDGTQAGISSLKAVMELAKKSGIDEQAADMLGRMTATFSLPVQSADFCRKAYGLYSGIDPSTGKTLTTSQQTGLALDLAAVGFSVADSAAKVSILLGASQTGTALTVGSVATGAGAVVAWAKVMKDVVDLGDQAIQGFAVRNFNERFPPAPGGTPETTIAGLIKRAEAMPTDSDNALSSTARMIDGFKGDTRGRFVEFLKRTVEPDSVVDKLKMGKFGEIDLSPQDMERLAKHTKRSVEAFITLEIQDVKRCTLPEGGLRMLPKYSNVGDYLREPLPAATPKVDLTRPEPPPLDTNRILGIPDNNDRMFQRILDKTTPAPTDRKPTDPAQTSPTGTGPNKSPVSELTDTDRRNVSAALALAATKSGMTDVDTVIPNRDGTRLIAIQGDERSEFNRTASVAIQEAAKVPAEESQRQIAQSQSEATKPQVEIETRSVQRVA